MSIVRWSDIEDLLPQLNSNDYSSRDPSQKSREAKAKIRRAFLAMEAKADENEDLRTLLTLTGIENANLSLAVDRARVAQVDAHDRAIEAEMEVARLTKEVHPTTPPASSDADREKA